MAPYLKRMPAGIAGSITRPLETTTEPGRLQPNTGGNAADAITEYGSAAVLDATTKLYRLPKAGDVAADIVFLPRPYPGGLAQFEGVLGVTPVDYVHTADVMKRGYMSMKLRAGTAAKGGIVYVRIAAAAAGKPLGGVEAAADGGNTVALDARTEFTGPAYTDSTFGAMTEIAFNI